MQGTVIDSRTQAPLWGANVYWRDESELAHGISTDDRGRFDLPSATGQPVVFVSFMGYTTKALQGVPGPVTVMLEASLEELPGVDVYPDAPEGSGGGGVAEGVGLLLLLMIALSGD